MADILQIVLQADVPTLKPSRKAQLIFAVLDERKRKKTNADRIRAMSDEELAKFIDDIAQSVADGEYCAAFLNVKNFPYSCEDTKKACVSHVVDWLHQPPKEG